jgi:hypothetical protein
MGRRVEQFLARIGANDRPLTVEEAHEFRRLSTLDNIDAAFELLRDDDQDYDEQRGGQR